MASNHFFEASIAQAMTAIAKIAIAALSAMSDISSAQTKVDDLNRGITGWNRVYEGALAIALVIGALSFWAQRQAMSRSRDLVEANKQLSEEKDRQLQRDLSDARDALEKEKTKRVEMEKSLARRELPIFIGRIDSQGKHDTNFEAIRPFVGVNVIIRALRDAEAERAASSIADVCNEAGLKVVSMERRDDLNIGFFDGVTVEPPEMKMDDLAPPSDPRDIAAFWKRPPSDAVRGYEIANGAANALVEVLLSNNWQQARTFPGGKDIPPNTIRVSVGFKPSPYFSSEPQWSKDMSQKSETQMHEYRLRRIKEIVEKYNLVIPK
jgi:hypothetical protein